MLFNSIEYLLFLPIVFICYWLLRNKLQIQNGLLLVASYFFYGLWDYRFLSLIIISSLADYSIALAIKKSDKKLNKKLLLFGSLAVNLGFLLVFKYYNFFLSSFVDLAQTMGFEASYSSLKIILPVGISFYTFQTLSYTIDVYRGKMEPTRNMLNFFTYVAFFPQLVAGPIERASNLLPQIELKRTFSNKKAIDGMRQILWGLFKKVAIADNCAVFVDSIFSSYGELGGGVLILGAVLFAFQIYCDFSGYSDIAIGTARLLGFNLMQNFATPYFARDIAEFWRRWHISLSTWFRDYVYIPLGGSRVGRWLQLRNVFAIFLISGFWHGANWTFIFWGLIHSLFYIPQVLSGSNRAYLDYVAAGKFVPSVLDIFRMARTFVIVTVAWVFFRSDSMMDSFQYLKRVFSSSDDGFFNELKEMGLDTSILNYIAIYVLIMLTFEWSNRMGQHGLWKLPKNIFLRYIIYIVLCLLVLEYFYGQRSFIYFQF